MTIHAFPGNNGSGVAPTGGPPHSGDMEALTKRVDRIESRLDGIDGRLRVVEVGLGRIEGKLDGLISQVSSFEKMTTILTGKLPSWWQMPAVIGGTVSLLIGMYAAIKYLGLMP